MLNKLVMDTLKPLNIPVNYMLYEGKEKTYVNFYNLDEKGELFADDVDSVIGYYIQISLFTDDKTKYCKYQEDIKTIMKSSGFKKYSQSPDLYEKDTQLYHKGMRFFYFINN